MTEYTLVLTTAGAEDEAGAIALALIETKLAACVNIFPVKSIYTWQGEVQRETEWQLLIKTRLSCFAALSAKITELHSYDTPEIVAIPIEQGSSAYLSWIGAQTH
ncbi:MAG: divalent-cation tolerance protein CutA [Phormidesmis sp. RL_2_1]|nr:divalent-cation tolerance protein CutA [Phormidesmis sp. RL_2_1]